MRRLLNALIYLFAALGFLASAGAVYVYIEGRKAEQRLDPNTPRVYREFARRMLAADAASASVLKLPLAEGVTVKEAIASMENRAAARNIKILGRFKPALGSPGRSDKGRSGKGRSDRGDADPGKADPGPPGGPERYAEVLHFCDAGTAAALLEYNPDFLAYMPCSIGLYVDRDGRGWLVTMNLDLLIHGGRELDPETKQRVLAVKEGLLDIMAAGAAGAL